MFEGGSISLDEFYKFTKIERTAFADRAFGILDEDQSGELDFHEVSKINHRYFHYLTLQRTSLLPVFGHSVRPTTKKWQRQKQAHGLLTTPNEVGQTIQHCYLETKPQKKNLQN